MRTLALFLAVLFVAGTLAACSRGRSTAPQGTSTSSPNVYTAPSGGSTGGGGSSCGGGGGA